MKNIIFIQLKFQSLQNHVDHVLNLFNTSLLYQEATTGLASYFSQQQLSEGVENFQLPYSQSSFQQLFLTFQTSKKRSQRLVNKEVKEQNLILKLRSECIAMEVDEMKLTFLTVFLKQVACSSIEA